MKREAVLFTKVRTFTWLFIVGLVLSGATAIPLAREVNWLVKVTGAGVLVQTPFSTNPPQWAIWLTRVQEALEQTNSSYPFLFYGTDWLAFGHFVIALAFVGTVLDPLRNQWLYVFGLIACALAIPYALVLGACRGIPLWWRFIDCSFGVIGSVPLWLCLRWTRELERLRQNP